MMKYKFLALLVFVISDQLFGQYLKVEYERIDLQNFKSESSQEFNNKVNSVRKTPMESVLFYADGYSFYKTTPRKTFVHDAGKVGIGLNEKTKREVFKEFQLKVYHTKSENGSYSYYDFPEINEEFYGYTEMNYKNIAYKDDVQKIDNYYCRLVEATLVNNAVAKIWYTEDIPVSTGPMGFNTFPGLVLRVELPDSVITAVKIGNDSKKSEIEKINPKLKVYKGDEFQKKMQEIREIRSKPTTQEIRL